MAQGRKTGGRRAGTPNRSTVDLRELIDAVADPEALVKELVRLARGAEREETRLQAIRELLDRRFGRPTQAVEAPLQSPTYVIEAPLPDLDADAWAEEARRGWARP